MYTHKRKRTHVHIHIQGQAGTQTVRLIAKDNYIINVLLRKVYFFY